MSDLNKYKTKKKIGQQLNDQDWKLQSYDLDESDAIKIMLYFYDFFDTREFMMAGLREGDLERLQNSGHQMDAIIESVDSAFKIFADERHKKSRANQTALLGSVLGLYMVNTETYGQLVGEVADKGHYRHFVVLRYKNKNTIQSTLRPFSLVSDSKMLAPEEIHELALSVIERDEKNNSAYFNFKPVTPIRR